MNILQIARKELLIHLRDKRTFIFMIAFPLVLILILGTALTNAFSSNLAVGDMNLLYKDNIRNGQLASSWGQFVQASQQEGITFTKAAADEDGLKTVQDDQYTAYAELSDDGIKYYGSPKNAIENNIIQGMLTVYADKFNLAAAAFKADPSPSSVANITVASGSFGNFIQETSLNKDKQPGSIDYYAISMTTMIAFYACLPASALIQNERTRRTAIRLGASPVSKIEIFTGKVLATTIVNFLCIAIVVLFSRLAFKAEWGSHYISIALVLLTEVVLAVSFGLACSYLFNGGAARAFIFIVIQVISFVGGAYFPIDITSGVVHQISQLSPLRWANQGLTQIIYSDQASAAIPVIVLNVGLSAALLIVSGLYMRKREGL
ncbi:ABC transporter permease [Paenibacillus caui]|uniref:ABC transporter permease n=1 Tax=Paenibacillus caui TaxID=2873927 RepID=UPI001CA9FE8F